MKADPATGKIVYPENDLVRLAIPRRVYTDRHLDFVAETVIETMRDAKKVRGLEMTYSPPHLKHFLAEFRPVG